VQVFHQAVIELINEPLGQSSINLILCEFPLVCRSTRHLVCTERVNFDARTTHKVADYNAAGLHPFVGGKQVRGSSPKITSSSSVHH
jgi:hypothetical protein